MVSTRRRGAGLNASSGPEGARHRQTAWERLRADCSISTTAGQTHIALVIKLEGSIYNAHFQTKIYNKYAALNQIFNELH